MLWERPTRHEGGDELVAGRCVNLVEVTHRRSGLPSDLWIVIVEHEGQFVKAVGDIGCEDLSRTSSGRCRKGAKIISDCRWQLPLPTHNRPDPPGSRRDFCGTRESIGKHLGKSVGIPQNGVSQETLAGLRIEDVVRSVEQALSQIERSFGYVVQERGDRLGRTDSDSEEVVIDESCNGWQEFIKVVSS